MGVSVLWTLVVTSADRSERCVTHPENLHPTFQPAVGVSWLPSVCGGRLELQHMVSR